MTPLRKRTSSTRRGKKRSSPHPYSRETVKVKVKLEEYDVPYPDSESSAEGCRYQDGTNQETLRSLFGQVWNSTSTQSPQHAFTKWGTFPLDTTLHPSVPQWAGPSLIDTSSPSTPLEPEFSFKSEPNTISTSANSIAGSTPKVSNITTTVSTLHY